MEVNVFFKVEEENKAEIRIATGFGLGTGFGCRTDGTLQ
jgi:hypothetical protein